MADQKVVQKVMLSADLLADKMVGLLVLPWVAKRVDSKAVHLVDLKVGGKADL